MAKGITCGPDKNNTLVCYDLDIDKETWFRVTAHALPAGSLLVKFEQDWAKERKYSKTGIFLDVLMTLYLEALFKVTEHS